MKKKSIFAFVIYAVVIIAVISLLASSMNSANSQQKEISIEELWTKMENGEIYSAYYDRNDGSILAVEKSDNEEMDADKTDRISSRYDFRADYINTDEAITQFQNIASENGVKYGFVPVAQTSIFELLLPYLIMLVIFGVIMYFIYQQTQGANSKAAQFSRANARMYADGKDKVTFADVAGADEEKEELSEIVGYLKNPTKYINMGARIPKGILLVGSPGTGKTLLAKAVAGEAGVPFFSITGSDFVELYVGIGASRVRDLFGQAKRNAPCIIFIDEIDAVGRQRGAGLGGGHDEREQTLNQLLVEMDGFNANEGIIVMAATNRADILDPALLRSGRFDRQIHVLMPDVLGREEIFKVHARNKKLAPDVSPAEIARLTIGFTGADIENLLNEAALLAVRRDKSEIGMQEIKDAITKVMMGPEKKSRKITPEKRRMTAYHEAGHALVAKLLPNCDPVSEVSIIGRGGVGGYTMTMPEEDEFTASRHKMQDDLCMTMGGRVAEEYVFDDISSGAAGDIKQATKMAHIMVTEYGMYDEIGPVYLGGGNEIFLGRDFSAQKSVSDAWEAKVDDAVHEIIKNAYERCRKVIGAHLDMLHKIANTLLDKEKISGDEFNALFAQPARGDTQPAAVEGEASAEKALDDGAEQKGNPAGADEGSNQ